VIARVAGSYSVSIRTCAELPQWPEKFFPRSCQQSR
jgi:hypothetical protein